MGTASPARFRVYYVDTFEETSGPGRDGWGLMAELDDEAEALAFAEEQANKPQPGAGELADRVVVIAEGRGVIFSRQRDGLWVSGTELTPRVPPRAGHKEGLIEEAPPPAPTEPRRVAAAPATAPGTPAHARGSGCTDR